MHVAVIGCGRIGQSLAMLLINEWYVSKLTLVDIVPNLARAVAEDLKHASTVLRRDVKIESYEKVEEVENADMIVITAGSPRRADQSRRDLAVKNAKIIKNIAENVYDQNKKSWFLVVTNPVDAMATLFYQKTKSDKVIGSGTHLDTIRFRSILSERLKVRIIDVDGFIAGEHGEAAVFLWSTVKIKGMKIEEVVKGDLESFKREIENKVKEVAAWIIKYSGATIYGPVHAFREIIRSILLNQRKVLSIATPFETGVYKVYISLPSIVGNTIQPITLNELTKEEKEKILFAAKTVYKTLKEAIGS